MMPKHEDWGQFFDLRGRRTKMERFFDLSASKVEDGGWVLRSSGPKNEEPHLRFSKPKDRRTAYLRSSIFGPGDRRTPHLRSSVLKNGFEDRTKDGKGGCDFFEDGEVLRSSRSEERRTPPSSIFGAGRTKNAPYSTFSTRRSKNPPPSSSSDLPPSTKGHHLLPAMLRSSSARSSTLKIGPKIEIGPLSARGAVVSWANRSVGVPSCPAPPRPAAPPCAAPTRPARGMSGFWIRQVLRSGSSARSSTSKIGPKIEIGPLHHSWPLTSD